MGKYIVTLGADELVALSITTNNMQVLLTVN